MYNIKTAIDTTEENSIIDKSKAPEAMSRVNAFLQAKQEKMDRSDVVEVSGNEVNVVPSIERSDFEKSLFKDGDNVDFHDYIDTHELFDALNSEAKNGTEGKYADYRESLLKLLQHCYGYYYKLMNMKEAKQRKLKILEIDSMITDENKTSNVNNSLHAKIIKLTWRGTDIGTKRISTYANLLGNAFTKGELINGETDSNGSILPEYFLEAVTENGGINTFSRISAKSIEKKNELKSEGFDSQGDKILSSVKKAIELGEFIADADNSKAIAIKPIDMTTELSELEEGGFGVVLVKYSSESSDSVEAIYASADTGKVDTLLRMFYSKLEKESIPEIVKPLIIKYKKQELRSIAKAMELLDVNGGDVDKFLDTLHVDKEKFNHLRLIPS